MQFAIEAHKLVEMVVSPFRGLGGEPAAKAFATASKAKVIRD